MAGAGALVDSAMEVVGDESGADAAEEAGGDWCFGEMEGYGTVEPGAGAFHAPHTAGVLPGLLLLVPQGHGRLSLVLVLAGGRSLLVRRLDGC